MAAALFRMASRPSALSSPAWRRHMAAGASLGSTPASRPTSTVPAAAGIAVLGGGFMAGYSWLMSPSTAIPKDVEVVTSQAQLDEIRNKRFSEGIQEAIAGAVSAVGIYCVHARARLESAPLPAVPLTGPKTRLLLVGYFQAEWGLYGAGLIYGMRALEASRSRQ